MSVRQGGPLTGYDLYKLPEFRALCEKIGIPWDLDTLGLTIVLPAGEGERVQVHHKYALPRPAGAKTPLQDAPFVVLDTPKGVHVDDMRRWAERQANLLGKEVRFAHTAVWYVAAPEKLCVPLADAEPQTCHLPGGC